MNSRPDSDGSDSVLKIPDRFGVYLWWPVDGDDWIHPDDVALCHRLIPSPRVFQREFLSAKFNLLTYGPYRLKVRPTMWLEIDTDGYLVGDRIEIRSRMGKRRPAIGTIEDIFYNRQTRSIDYFFSINNQRQSTALAVEEFQPAFELDKPMDLRQRALAEKYRLM